MTPHDTALAFGYLGSVLGVVMVVPQIVRILRHPQLPGVSTLSWSLTALACSTWLIYGLRTGSTPQIPGNVLLVSGAVAVVLLAPARHSRLARVATISAAGVAAIVLAWLIPGHDVGYLGFSIGLFSTWPQLYDSVGNWRARISSGVSVSTWVLRIGSQLCWLAYAIGASDLPVFISACVSLTLAGLLVSFEVAARVPQLARATG